MRGSPIKTQLANEESAGQQLTQRVAIAPKTLKKKGEGVIWDARTIKKGAKEKKEVPHTPT